MSFYSLEFFALITLTLLLYYLVNSKYQKALLFIASSVFIITFSIYFLCYTYIFILFNYFIINLLKHKKYRENIRKLICNIGIGLNITLLVFYKYINFVVDNINDTFDLFNIQYSLNNLNLIIPLGISYYTFQGIGYILQVFRELEIPERNIFIFSNYFIFFPKFLSGPIEISKSFIPQLKTKQSFLKESLKSGIILILWGAFKKVVLADKLLLIINTVFHDVNNFSGGQIFLTLFILPLHLYCDFSGYTDIALGIGRTFGFQLTDNFKRPFFASSVSEFWRRWHISLSGWCNEFIYRRLSLKLRRWGIWAAVYAVFITFLVIGIWHGPNWKYLILGILQGIAINYEFFTKKRRYKTIQKINPIIAKFGGQLITYLFMCFSLTFFYAENSKDAIEFISNLFIQNVDGISLKLFFSGFDRALLPISFILMMIFEFWHENKFKVIPVWWLKPVFIILLIYIFLINYVNNSTIEPFIYTLF